jgi:hypothetical protein
MAIEARLRRVARSGRAVFQPRLMKRRPWWYWQIFETPRLDPWGWVKRAGRRLNARLARMVIRWFKERM